MSEIDLPGISANELRFHVSRPVVWFDQHKSVLPQGATLLTGRPKSGKSLLCEQVATEVAENKLVAYFAFEYGSDLMKNRFKRHLRAGYDYSQLRLFSREDVPPKEMPLTFVERVLRTASERDQPYQIAVIDVLNKVKPRNDGSYDRKYDAIAPITALAPRFVEALLVVHHSRKKDVKQTATSQVSVDEALGSTAIAGAFDTVVGLQRHGDIVTLVHESRLFEQREHSFRLADGTLTSMTKIEADVVRLQDSAPLQSNIAEYISAHSVTQTQLAAALGVSVVSVNRAVKGLADKKIIVSPTRGCVLQLNLIPEKK